MDGGFWMASNGLWLPPVGVVGRDGGRLVGKPTGFGGVSGNGRLAAADGWIIRFSDPIRSRSDSDGLGGGSGRCGGTDWTFGEKQYYR